MCGIFGAVSASEVTFGDLKILAKNAEQRGRDSSGLFYSKASNYQLIRSNQRISQLVKRKAPSSTQFIMGHSRLITDGLADNQPVYRDGVCVLHNGIVVNHSELWASLELERELEIDSEIIAGIAAEMINKGEPVEEISTEIIRLCKGVVACALAFPKLGKLCLFSNNGSLYKGLKADSIFFSSERYPLESIDCVEIEQVLEGTVLQIPLSLDETDILDIEAKKRNLIPALGSVAAEEKLIQFPDLNLKRCTKCILPETMPFIYFSNDGVCNYCQHYQPRNVPRPKKELFDLIEPYRRSEGSDCIVPFSGGRDSCFGLHLIVNELKMKAITYTYDWGMVTDLGRRNISRMCAQLGVENIIVADDIGLKRRYIANNLNAWLRAPHLGMISILTAGDKHFFRHVETVKKQTGISLNLWGVNPLEVTHFKAGFLGVPPDFEEKQVYSNGALKQMRYQWLRLKAMVKSPGYFNRSLWDTLSGEYYRSFTEKSDYYHVFDYWRWDEDLINSTLDEYDWERAPDTSTTWRIGDGTAAFYNYIYYTVAGFTEHDTFRSNQIREGDITREEALVLVADENRPRYPNIKWYLDALGLDFKQVIDVVNSIPRLGRVT
jgi:glutamine---fructose-6-phosphate transaminase (isomerizing)